jgi:hypothetical protein
MLNRSFGDAICHLRQPRRQESVLLVANQPTSRHTAHTTSSAGSKELTETPPLPPTRNSSAAQPGRTSHVIVRHFFDWPGRNARRHYQSRPTPSQSPARHYREDYDGATARRGSSTGAHARISTNHHWLKRKNSRRRHSSIESRVGDRGFWLQTRLYRRP